jgi:hypothetical protein
MPFRGHSALKDPTRQQIAWRRAAARTSRRSSPPAARRTGSRSTCSRRDGGEVQANGIKVHGVAYTRDQARQPSRTIPSQNRRSRQADRELISFARRAIPIARRRGASCVGIGMRSRFRAFFPRSRPTRRASRRTSVRRCVERLYGASTRRRGRTPSSSSAPPAGAGRAAPSLCAPLMDAPPVGSVGDAHAGNFGLWRDAERRLLWSINDFDEAVRLPCPLDLLRLCASILLADRGAEATDRAARLLRRARLAATFRVEEKHLWLGGLFEADHDKRREFCQQADRGGGGGVGRHPCRRRRRQGDPARPRRASGRMAGRGHPPSGSPDGRRVADLPETSSTGRSRSSSASPMPMQVRPRSPSKQLEHPSSFAIPKADDAAPGTFDKGPGHPLGGRLRNIAAGAAGGSDALISAMHHDLGDASSRAVRTPDFRQSNGIPSNDGLPHVHDEDLPGHVGEAVRHEDSIGSAISATSARRPSGSLSRMSPSVAARPRHAS